MEKLHLVYVHKRMTDGSVFYVGMGSGRRPYVTSNRNPHWKNIAAKNGVDVEIVFRSKSQACCKTIERFLIYKIGLESLCNITAGGEATSGWKPTFETREKISKATKRAWIEGKHIRTWCEERRLKLSQSLAGALNPMSGRKLSVQHRKKISEALKGENHPLYGKPQSQKTKNAISEKLKGRNLSDSHKESISNGMRGRRMSKESVEKSATARENKEKFSFVHSSGEKFTGTMRLIAKEFSLDRSAITKVATGKAKTHKGWRLS